MELLFIILLMFLSFLVYGIFNVVQDTKDEKLKTHNKKLYELRKDLERLRNDSGYMRFSNRRYWVRTPYLSEEHTITVVKPDPFHPFIPESGVLVFGSDSKTVAVLPEDFGEASAKEITSLLNVTVGQLGQ